MDITKGIESLRIEEFKGTQSSLNISKVQDPAEQGVNVKVLKGDSMYERVPYDYLKGSRANSPKCSKENRKLRMRIGVLCTHVLYTDCVVHTVCVLCTHALYTDCVVHSLAQLSPNLFGCIL